MPRPHRRNIKQPRRRHSARRALRSVGLPPLPPAGTGSANDGRIGGTVNAEAPGLVSGKAYVFGDAMRHRAKTRASAVLAGSASILGMFTLASPAVAADFDPTVPMVSVAGDIACGTKVAGYNNGDGTATQCRQKYTAPLLAGSDAVWTLGDHVYPVATSLQFTAAYEPTWGRYRAITYPTPGDHDYGKIAGKGYFAYFGRPQYYSFDTAGWHVVSLNSEIDHSETSAQVTWLQNDLAATAATCVAAYWAEPRWTSSKKAPGNATFDPFVQALHAAGADLILAGDAHHYERFAKMAPDGTTSQAGMREFVVGTGGRSLEGFPKVQPNSDMRVKAFGVLQLALHETSYDWQFLDESRAVRDAGSEACNS
jgi:acid phosphatase type 7